MPSRLWKMTTNRSSYPPLYVSQINAIGCLWHMLTINIDSILLISAFPHQRNTSHWLTWTQLKSQMGMMPHKQMFLIWQTRVYLDDCWMIFNNSLAHQGYTGICWMSLFNNVIHQGCTSRSAKCRNWQQCPPRGKYWHPAKCPSQRYSSRVDIGSP